MELDLRSVVGLRPFFFHWDLSLLLLHSVIIMKSHERILFVADARLIYRGTTMETSSKNEVKPGLNLKKIVVTTHKLYVFRALSNEADDIEYRLQNSRKPKPMEQLDDRAAR